MNNAREVGTQYWPPWVTLAIGAWVFISPWALGFYAASQTAAWNYWILGGIAVLFSIVSLASIKAIRMEWINIVAGGWLVISPWVVGYSPLPKATPDAVLAGLLLAIFAGWAIYGVGGTTRVRSG